MKIGQPVDNKHAAAPHGATGTPASATPAPASAPTAAPARAIPDRADDSAKIRLSNAASSLLDGGASNAEFDADKVARISKSIDEGSFKIDASKIADKLISNAQELLTGRRN